MDHGCPFAHFAEDRIAGRRGTAVVELVNPRHIAGNRENRKECEVRYIVLLLDTRAI